MLQLTHRALGLLVFATLTAANLVPVDLHPLFETHHVFCGEFACINETVSGPHEFLRFEMKIHNDGPQEVYLPASERFLSAFVIDPSTDTIVAEHLDISMPFLRDTACSDGHPPRRVRGSDFRLSSGCSSVFAPAVSCFWVDVSNLTLPNPVRLRVTFGSYELTRTFLIEDAEHNRHVNSTVGSSLVPGYFLIVYFAGFIHYMSRKRTPVEKTKS